MLDGVYRGGADGGAEFVEVGAPTDDEVHALLQTLIARLMKMLNLRNSAELMSWFSSMRGAG